MRSEFSPLKRDLDHRHDQKRKVFLSIKDFRCRDFKRKPFPDLGSFLQTDSWRGKDKKEIGLGLSIVREIIYAHR